MHIFTTAFYIYILLSKMRRVTLRYSYFLDYHDQWNWLIESTLYWAFLLVLVLHRGQRLQPQRRGFRVILLNTSKALWPRSQMGHRASRRWVGSVWVINIILNSDTSDLAQTTSVVKHFSQHQIETVFRCSSTIYCCSFDLCWRSFWAEHNDITYKSICSDNCLN